MASTENRVYDIVVLGATGYTARICAEYIARKLPTDLKWAVAGRSESKLQTLVEKLKVINVDRRPPSKSPFVGKTNHLFDNHKVLKSLD